MCTEQSKIVIQNNALQNLEIKCNSNEKYSCGSCIPIHGVDYNKIVDLINVSCDEIGVTFDPTEITRHRILVSPFLRLT